MAAYNIVLNLSGNAVTRVEKLAAALAAASASAKSLAMTLPTIVTGVNSMNTGALTGMRALTAPQIRAMGAAQAAMIRAQSAASVAATRAASQAARATASAQAANARRARLYYGSNFSFGSFGGRFSQMLPMSPGMSNAIGGTMAAAQIAGSLAKQMVKWTARATALPLLAGAAGVALPLRALQSEGFAEGVRLISRRHQARMGLGAEYEAAERNTDYLASSYGLDRSTALSSINVLTGLKVAALNKKLSLADATRLTQTGGLISQHHGVPFERVMTNIQQLLVQQTPHMRDIRELLNQAPILGKYAIREMESRGIQGTSTMAYLKDQRNIFSVLERYRLDIATNAGMQARGQINLAWQDFWAKIASNDKFWRYTGNAGEGVIGSMGDAISNTMTTLEKNQDFRVLVQTLESTFTNIADGVDKWLPIITQLLERMATKWGIQTGDLFDKEKVGRERAAEVYGGSAKFRNFVAELLENAGGLKGLAPESREKAIDEEVGRQIRFLRKAAATANYFVGVGKLYDDNADKLPSTPDNSVFRLQGNYTTMVDNTPGYRRRINSRTIENAFNSNPAAGFFRVYSVENPNATGNEAMYGLDAWKLPKAKYPWLPGVNSRIKDSPFSYYAFDIKERSAQDAVRANFEAMRIEMSENAKKLQDTKIDGDDLTGVNRDRRSLTINFNAPIVDGITNQINSDEPKQVAEEVFVNAEDAIAAGIQKALLGATGKMHSRFL